MKKIAFFFFAILLILSLFSCSFFDTEDDQKVASEVSDSISNQENGLIQELSDNSSLVSGDTTTMKSYISDIETIEKAVEQKASVTLTYNNALSTGFIWDDTNKCYSRTITDIDIDSTYFTGKIISVTLKVWFFESEDATGEAVELTNTPRNLANNTYVKSMKYERHIESELTNKENGNKRTYTIDSAVTITEINDEIDGVHMVGTRTAHRTFDGENYDATWDIEENFDCDAYREILEGSTYYTTYEGTAHISAVGNITWENGSKEVTRETDISFNKTRYVTITINDTTVTIDIVTGQQIQ